MEQRIRIFNSADNAKIAYVKSGGPTIQWVQSFVADDKIYCVYIAPDEETVKQHAQKGGFPANKIARVRSMIDPTTAE